MKNFFHSLTQASRKKKHDAKEIKFVNRLRFAYYESFWREKTIESKTPGIGNDTAESITISLTSYGARIETVYLTIESLMQQSLKADRIVLCLVKNEFSEENLPATLKSQRKRGLEIIFCDDDIRSYKKFFYTMRKYPKDLIITVDDDVIYPIDTVDLLYRAYIREPEVIHCNRAYQMTSNEQGMLSPYKKWNFDHTVSEPSFHTFPTGVGGVLYFPGSLDDAIFDKEVFLKLAPNADDVWLKAMSLKKAVKCRQIKNNRPFKERFIEIPGSQTISLKRTNKNKYSGNDLAISQVFSKYDLYGIIG